MPEDTNDLSEKDARSTGIKVKVDIPADVSRDTVRFFQKLLGPITDAAEFISDKIRFKRWETAIKAVSMAETICKENGIEPREVPIKFLWPFLEKVSLEDKDSPLMGQWSRLLASAAVEFDPVQHAYANILSNINHDQAHILRKMYINTVDDYHSPIGHRLSLDYWSGDSEGAYIQSFDLVHGANQTGPGQVDSQGRLIIFRLSKPMSEERLEYDLEDHGSASLANSMYALEQQNLVHVQSVDADNHIAVWAGLTPFGVDFVRVCQGE